MKAPIEEINGKSTANQRKGHNVEKYIQGLRRCCWHSVSSCCLPNLRNPAKFSENSNL